MALGLINIWNAISAAYTINNVLNTIELILNHEESIIRRIAKAYRKSALQGIEAARKGNRDAHLAVVLGDLRKIYNLLEDTANRKARWYEWLDDATSGVSSRTYHSRDSHEEMAEVASLISLGHKSMNEFNSAEDWAKLALIAFDKYEQLSMEIATTPELKGSSRTGYWAKPIDENFIKQVKEDLENERKILKNILKKKQMI